MRAPAVNRQRIPRALSALVLSAGLISSVGCAKRLQLSPAEFERIDKQEQATQDLRVYVSKKTVIVYEADDRNATYEVDRTINTSQDQQLLRVIIGRSTMGQIIDKEERNGAPLLWVTFSKRCAEKDCAYGFVMAEDGVFRLTEVPEREGYLAAKVYLKSDRNDKKLLKLNKLRSLAEKNDVYVLTKKNGKTKTVDLIVKKRNTNKKQTTTIRDGGVR